MRKHKVLIIDDNMSMAKALKRLLDISGYSVTTVNDSAIAMETIRQELPELILLDILMPHINGYEICRQIKEDPALRHIPVIMLSARDMGDDIETALKYNADWYIVKPYDEKYLMERIRSFLEPAESTVASGTDVFPGKYRHYKGNYYQVIAVARHSETEEEMVVYRKLYDDFSWWVRPKKMFIETIMINDTPVRRFLYIGPIDPP